MVGVYIQKVFFTNLSVLKIFLLNYLGAYFDVLLEMVADEGRILFRLFQHQSLAIVKGAGLVMKAIIEVNALILSFNVNVCIIETVFYKYTVVK